MDVTEFWDAKVSAVEKVPNELVVSCGVPKPMLTAHWHAQVEVNYVFAGTLVYDMDGYRLAMPQGTLALFWGGQPHRLTETVGDCYYHAIHLPLVHFFRLRIPRSVQGQLLRGATILAAAVQAEDDPAFRRRGDWMTSGDQRLVDHAVAELLLRLERIGFEAHSVHHAKGVACAEDEDRAGGHVVERLSSFIATNFREDIDCTDMAAHAEVHPKYAMAVFKKSTGMSLLDYLSLLRISYAQSLLSVDRSSVLDIAMDSGFGSLSAFNKCFRKRAGMTPSEFKRQQRSAPTQVVYPG